jgi:hypothetical protein
MRPTLLEFIDKMKIFKMTPYQEKLIELLSSTDKVTVMSPYQRGKEYINDEIACSKLIGMKQGEKFGLAHPKGLYIFKLIKVKKYATN